MRPGISETRNDVLAPINPLRILNVKLEEGCAGPDIGLGSASSTVIVKGIPCVWNPSRSMEILGTRDERVAVDARSKSSHVLFQQICHAKSPRTLRETET